MEVQTEAGTLQRHAALNAEAVDGDGRVVDE